MTVFRRLRGNALAISQRLNELLPELRKTAPPGIEITQVYDQGNLVRTSIANVRDAILIGGAFSVLILLLFLRSIRATLLTAVSIPLSLIITFVFLHLTGDTLNLMSLGGLAVAIGLIIDDSVVVVENIARHLAEGQSGDEAIDRASREISGAVIGSTLTTILVFLPLAFVHGVVGQFFQSLSLSLTVALLVSMVVSLTIIPVLASRFLANRAMPTSGPIYRVMADVYERALRLGLRWPRLVMLLAILAVIPGGLIFPRLKTGFMPDMDEGAFVLDYFMPAGTSLTETDQGRPADRQDPERDARRGRLSPPHRGGERDLCHGGLPRRHRGRLEAARPAAADEQDLQMAPQGIERQGPRGADRAFALGPRPDQRPDRRHASRRGQGFRSRCGTLRGLAAQIGEFVEKAGAKDVNTNVHLGNPDLIVRPSREALARMGLNEQDIGNQLNAALYGQVAATLPQQDRLTDIRVRYPDAVRFDRDRLEHLPIALPPSPAASQSGPASGPPPPAFVTLSQVATIGAAESQ